MFGEKISAKACSGKEIDSSGFKEEEEEYDDTEIVKSCRSGFSRAKLNAGMNGLSLCIPTDGPESCCWCVLKA